MRKIILFIFLCASVPLWPFLRPALMLPAGEFVIEVQDPEGKPVKNFRIRKD
jgi:hypothetical protein